jgi:hypothetical protein
VTPPKERFHSEKMIYRNEALVLLDGMRDILMVKLGCFASDDVWLLAYPEAGLPAFTESG